jgi:hypothetical protein
MIRMLSGFLPAGMVACSRQDARARIAKLRLRGGFVIAATILLFSMCAGRARAVVNGHIDVTNTNVNPADYVPAVASPGQPAIPDWTQGDPGWNNISDSQSNYVYLGDGWVLTARHIAAGTAVFGAQSFLPVSGQNYVISNPPPSLANGVSLTTQTDLRLFKINGDPGLPALSIASESPTATGLNGSEVMFIGQGWNRFSTETHWNIPNLSSPPPNWSSAEVPSGGNVHGWKTADTTGTKSKRWGTNRLENPSSSQFQASAFDEILSPTTAVMPLTTADGGGTTRDVISMVTVFTQQGSAGALPFESQAVSGDSGGSVFYNRGTAEDPDWVLAGIVNATFIYGNQPRQYAVYNNATTFADLSYYNKPYKSSICDIMKACDAYSIVGDVNLDGSVMGDGTGATTTDDVSAFVAGWGNNNLAGKGDYETWIRGDLNLDGVTNVQDFVMLRGALNGPISQSAMQSMFGPVPEPSSAILALLGASAFSTLCRRRRR